MYVPSHLFESLLLVVNFWSSKISQQSQTSSIFNMARREFCSFFPWAQPLMSMGFGISPCLFSTIVVCDVFRMIINTRVNDWYRLSLAASAPVVASIFHLINDARLAKKKKPIGFVNPTLVRRIQLIPEHSVNSQRAFSTRIPPPW